MRSAKGWFLYLSLARKPTVVATATSAVSMTVLCATLGWYDASIRTRLVNV